MKLYKIMGIIAGMLGILLGITIIIVSIMDIDVPKLIWAIFGVVCFINAIGNIINYKESKNDRL